MLCSWLLQSFFSFPFFLFFKDIINGRNGKEECGKKFSSILYIQYFGIIPLWEKDKGSECTSIKERPCLQIYFSIALLRNLEIISRIHSWVLMTFISLFLLVKIIVKYISLRSRGSKFNQCICYAITWSNCFVYSLLLELAQDAWFWLLEWDAAVRCLVQVTYLISFQYIRLRQKW